jgi:hypothetical protein
MPEGAKLSRNEQFDGVAARMRKINASHIGQEKFSANHDTRHIKSRLTTT